MIPIAALLAISSGQATTTSVPVTLDGDRRPDTITQSFEAACGADVVRVEMQTAANRSSSLTMVSVNGRNALGTAEVKGANAFLRTVRFPSLMAVMCPERAISFGIMGGPLSGDINFYRVTIPRRR